MMLFQLMIPGTHDSTKIGRFEGYFANAIFRRWSKTQEESIWNQLVMGARFLDVSHARLHLWEIMWSVGVI